MYRSVLLFVGMLTFITGGLKTAHTLWVAPPPLSIMSCMGQLSSTLPGMQQNTLLAHCWGCYAMVLGALVMAGGIVWASRRQTTLVSVRTTR